jgi:hypothetical protein
MMKTFAGRNQMLIFFLLYYCSVNKKVRKATVTRDTRLETECGLSLVGHGPRIQDFCPLSTKGNKFSLA